MPAETTGNKAAGMVPDELKFEPKSTGLTTPRKKKPKELAVITECCTGCAGSPACVEYCPVADCMFWVPDEDHPPFGRIQDRSDSLHWLQEVHQQGSGRLFPRWLPVGCDCDGGHSGSGKRSGRDEYLVAGLQSSVFSFDARFGARFVLQEKVGCWFFANFAPTLRSLRFKTFGFAWAAESDKLYRKGRKGTRRTLRSSDQRDLRCAISYLATLLALSRMALSVNAACCRI